MEEAPEESWGDGFLPFGRRIGIVKGFEEGAQCWPQVGAVLDVKGARLEMVPKRRSQAACGRAQSADSLWFLTLSDKFTCLRPVSVAVEVEESSDDSFFFIWLG